MRAGSSRLRSCMPSVPLVRFPVLHKDGVGTSGTHKRECVGDLRVRIPWIGTLGNERSDFLLNLVPDVFDLAGHAQIAAHVGIAEFMTHY